MLADQEWFAELYQGSYRRLVLTAYALTHDLGAAEEVTQEAFALAYARAPRVAAADSPEAWLRTVVVNLAKRRWRRRTMLDRILRREPLAETVEPPGAHLSTCTPRSRSWDRSSAQWSCCTTSPTFRSTT